MKSKNVNNGTLNISVDIPKELFNKWVTTVLLKDLKPKESLSVSPPEPSRRARSKGSKARASVKVTKISRPGIEPWKIAQISKQLRDGKAVNAIAEHYGLSWTTVNNMKQALK